MHHSSEKFSRTELQAVHGLAPAGPDHQSVRRRDCDAGAGKRQNLVHRKDSDSALLRVAKGTPAIKEVSEVEEAFGAHLRLLSGTEGFGAAQEKIVRTPARLRWS